MEVVDSWKPEGCCESNTRFYESGFLETNSVQKFPCQRISNKHCPRLPLDYISGRAEKVDSFLSNYSFVVRP
jgi:hypothetical protein